MSVTNKNTRWIANGNHNTRSTEKSRPFSKPRRQFLITLYATIHLICGKVNFTNLSRYSELSERTYRRQFNRGYDFIKFNQALISEALGPAVNQIGVIDCSFLPKSGKATYGLDRFYNGKASRAERGLEISMIAVVDVGQSLGYALSVQQTPALADSVSVASEAQSKTKVDEVTRVDHYLTHLEATRAALPTAVRYLVGDGFYRKIKWVEGVKALNLEVIGKLRCDANLRYVYTGAQKKRGARRKYDGKVFFNDLSRFQSIDEVGPGISLYSAVLWSIGLKRKIRVVYLLNRTHPEHPCYAVLFSTDVDIDPMALYQAYRARFQIEFIFRDAKQFTGLSDCQARDAQKLDFHFNAALTALNLAKWDDYLHRPKGQPFVFSMASYKRRKLNLHLLQRFIDNLDLDPVVIKSHPNYPKLCDYGTILS